MSRYEATLWRQVRQTLLAPVNGIGAKLNTRFGSLSEREQGRCLSGLIRPPQLAASCWPCGPSFAPNFLDLMRFAAGAAGFLILIQQSARPDRYGEHTRFETMPSQPSAHDQDFQDRIKQEQSCASRFSTSATNSASIFFGSRPLAIICLQRRAQTPTTYRVGKPAPSTVQAPTIIRAAADSSRPGRPLCRRLAMGPDRTPKQPRKPKLAPEDYAKR